MTSELKPCPFCGGKAQVLISDHEGNIKNPDYIQNPWSGLAFKLSHTYLDGPSCPIATYPHEEGESLGIYLYDSPEEAIQAWNKRHS